MLVNRLLHVIPNPDNLTAVNTVILGISSNKLVLFDYVINNIDFSIKEVLLDGNDDNMIALTENIEGYPNIFHIIDVCYNAREDNKEIKILLSNKRNDIIKFS